MKSLKYTPRKNIKIISNDKKIKFKNKYKMIVKNNFLMLKMILINLDKKYNKNKLNISFNRIAFIFFIFVLVLLYFH